MQHSIFSTIIEGYKGVQIAVNSSASGGGVGGDRVFQHVQDNNVKPNNSFINGSVSAASVGATDPLLPIGLPVSDMLEPKIEPCLKFVDFVDTLADLYRRMENCPQLQKCELYVEQFAVFRGFPDPKFYRHSLRSARQHAVDVHSKIVLAAWLRFERREDDLIGNSAMDCGGRNVECPKATLVAGYFPESVYEPCACSRTPDEEEEEEEGDDDEEDGCSCSTLKEEDGDISFCVGDDEIRCIRSKIATLSKPFKAMLYGNFRESRREKISFAQNGISVEGMRVVEVFSRTKRLHFLDPHIILEILSFANKFCCDELKHVCDSHLASLVSDLEDAMLLIEHGLEENASLLVAACLQVFLKELPTSMHCSNVIKIFSSCESKQKLDFVGHASFLLYYLLSQIAMEEDMKSNMTVMLLERLSECATEKWQKQLAYHQLGVVMLEREEYIDAEQWFEVAVEAGHLYSLVGVARAKFKHGHKYKAFKMMNSIISNYKTTGWMCQERSLYCVGKEKLLDIDIVTQLDPSLSFPYKFRAIAFLEDDQVGAAITEINKIIGFNVSPDCLELRAWIHLAVKDYEEALIDVRALLTLEPNYVMFNGTMQGDHLLKLLLPLVQPWSEADCWMQLYDRWSAVDDIGSMAVVHHMLEKEPGKSLLWFRQSLLLLRLNSQKAAMRCLRMARNHSHSDHEKLIYEGWILYDTGHREEALAKAEESLSIQRSFEAFFLKAFMLADTSLDEDASDYVIHLLQEALKCPSDGLRKGQALNNLAGILVDYNKLDQAADYYTSALNIKHTRAHQGLARVYHLKDQRKAAYDEMTKLIEKAQSNASAYEKRSEYCDLDMAKSDLSMATQLDPLRTYPYRYRAAALMDDHKEEEAIAELSRAIAFKLDSQLLYLRAAFQDSVGDYASTLGDCEAALCLNPHHGDTLELYIKARERLKDQKTS